ncbi:hypothetical protein NDI39_02725 [Microcoleus sp. ZQ-A2]|nr:hypothetical protein [Microcoleus sp. FACHB-1]
MNMIAPNRQRNHAIAMLKSTQATQTLHVPVSALLGYNLALLAEGLVYLERGSAQ